MINLVHNSTIGGVNLLTIYEHITEYYRNHQMTYERFELNISSKTFLINPMMGSYFIVEHNEESIEMFSQVYKVKIQQQNGQLYLCELFYFDELFDIFEEE